MTNVSAPRLARWHYAGLPLAALLAFAPVSGLRQAQARGGGDINAIYAQIKQEASLGHYQRCVELSRQMGAIVARSSGTNVFNYSIALHFEGYCLRALGEYAEAAEKLKASIAIKQQTGDAASILRSVDELIETDTSLGRIEEANAYAKSALDMALSSLGADHVETAHALATLGKLAKNQEHYALSIGYYERALETLKRINVVATNPMEMVQAYENLGDVYGLAGRFNDGEKQLQAALALIAAMPNGAHSTMYAQLLNDLGNLYSDAARYSEAEATFKQGIKIYAETYGENHPNIAALKGNLATVYEAQSRFSEAEQLILQGLPITEKAYGSESINTIIALNGLANIYGAEGRYEEALAIQKRVLDTQEKKFGTDTPDTARFLGNLANTYGALQRYDEADKTNDRIISIFTNRLGANNQNVGQAYLNASDDAFHLEKQDKAADYAKRALDIIQKAVGPDHPDVIKPLNSVARAAVMHEAYDEALPYLTRSLDIATKRLGPTNSQTLLAYVNLAEVQKLKGNWQTAIDDLNKAKTAYIARFGVNEQATHDDTTFVYQPLIIADWHIGGASQNAGLMDDGFATAQRLQETQAGSALAQMAIRFGAGDNALAAAIRRKQDLQASLDGLDKKLTGELGAADGKRNDALIAALREESVTAHKNYDDVSARLAKDFPKYAELANPAPMTIAQVQALLKPDEVLVVFSSPGNKSHLRFTKNEQWSYVFAITREAAQWQQLDKAKYAIAQAVTNLRKGLWNDKPGEAAAPFDVQASYELYKALLGPVEGTMAGKSKLLVVPDGALTSLPFQVLVTKEPTPGLSPQEANQQAAWLIKDKAITTLPAVSSLRALRQFARVSKATKPFIGYGDPVLQRNRQPNAPGEKRMASKIVSRGVQPLSSYYRGNAINLDALRQGLAPLPETADELRAVAKVLGAPETDVHLQDDATLAKLEQTPLDQYKVVDFATHGLVAGEVAGLSEPALVMTLPERPNPDDNGLLTASRVAKLNLDADWAVLSACNTAAGEQPGAEGLSGLARAFFYAGARSLLVSHWPVDSAAAVKLTTGAFSAMAKDPSIGRAEAMRRSMLALIADKEHPDNADPSIWAPFALVGEGN